MANEPSVPVSAVEALAKEWTKHENFLRGPASLTLACVVMKDNIRDLRALIDKAREGAKPKMIYFHANENGELVRDAPPADTPHMCPETHGAEREMELQWVCETCGHRESADESVSAGTEGPGLRECLLKVVERYCGDADVGRGAEKTWTQWKADFVDLLIAEGEKR